MSPEAFAETRAGVITLLEHRRICHVIVVDDRPPVAGVEVVVAVVLSGTPIPKWAQKKMGVKNEGPDEIVRERVMNLWTGLAVDDRVRLVQDLTAASRQEDVNAGNENPGQHELFSAGIEALLPTGMVQWMLPHQWKAERDELLSRATIHDGDATYCDTLFLFDRDLGPDHGETAGESLALDLLREGGQLNIMCGVISNGFTPGTEGTVDIPSGAGLKAHRLVRISKRQIADEPRYFAYGLKKVVMSPYVDELRNRATELLVKAHMEAAAALRRIDPFDFAYAVIRRSDTDGEHELDTLLRLSQAHLRDAARRAARHDVGLRLVSKKLREVSGIAEKATLPKEHSVWRLQRLLMFENAEDLNGLFLPISLGDVFEVTDVHGAPRRYMLLGQPCDIAVRGSGIRKAATAILVRARDREKGDDKREGWVPLSYNQSETGRWGVIDFWDVRSIPMCVLDLTAYRSDGSASIDLIVATPPDGISVGASMRFSILRSEMTAVGLVMGYAPPIGDGEVRTLLASRPAKRTSASEDTGEPELDALLVGTNTIDADRHSESVREAGDRSSAEEAGIRDESETVLLLGRRILSQCFAKPEVVGTTVKFPIRRVDRLLGSHAADVLTRFAQHLSRAALDVDVAANTRDY